MVKEIACPNHVDAGEDGHGEFSGDTLSSAQIHEMNRLKYQLQIMRFRIESFELENIVLMDE